jgi:CRISPR/Cas system-associated endonuclease Cas3-HD
MIEIILAITVFLFSFFCLFLMYRINVIRKEYTKIQNKNILFEKYFNSIEENKLNSEENIHKENFIKFLSESRDWAYQYIEDVQNSLENFINSVDSDINHFDIYGDTISMARPDYNAMKNISCEYKKLKKLLPKEKI